MSTSTKHVPQKAKYSQQIFCLQIDKTANCLSGHGRPVWKRINVVGPRAVNGLNVAGYGRSGPETSWTVPSLLWLNFLSFFQWLKKSGLYLNIQWCGCGLAKVSYLMVTPIWKLDAGKSSSCYIFQSVIDSKPKNVW